MRLMRFNPQAEHVPGKQMVVADTLSRSPLLSEQEPLTMEDVATIHKSFVFSCFLLAFFRIVRN